MATVDQTGVVDVGIDQAWRVLRQFGTISTWHPAIADSFIEDGGADGTPGIVRHLALADGGIIRERLIALDDEDHILRYSIEDSPLGVENYRGAISLVALTGQPRSFLRWTVRFDAASGHDPETQREVVNGLIASAHAALTDFLSHQSDQV